MRYTNAKGRTARTRFLLKLLYAGCLLLLAGPCLAATVEPMQGNVYVSRGQGFAPIKGRVEAKAGDSVMVDPGGSAVIAYSDRCKVTVQPGTIATIAPSSPCKPCPPPTGQRCTASSPCNEPCAYLPGVQETGLGSNMVIGGILGAAGLGFGIHALFVKSTSHSASP
jgi:hypothetical protein